MSEMPQVIEQMLANRRVERVAVNLSHANIVIRMAEQHVQTAGVLAETDDQAMAFTAAYDAARKALTAVLAREGLRVRPVGGAHRNTGVAAAAFVADDSLGEFDWMRQVRNSTEYRMTSAPQRRHRMSSKPSRPRNPLWRPAHAVCGSDPRERSPSRHLRWRKADAARRDQPEALPVGSNRAGGPDAPHCRWQKRRCGGAARPASSEAPMTRRSTAC